MNNFDFKSMSNQLLNYDSLNEEDRLSLLLTINKQVDDEIKRLSTNNNKHYADLLRCKIVEKIDGVGYKDSREIKWTPQKNAEYERLRRIITKEIGNLGKIITKSQYEKALEVLERDS